MTASSWLTRSCVRRPQGTWCKTKRHHGEQSLIAAQGNPLETTLSSNLPECRAEQISVHPRAYVYHNFLSPEECDHIVALAKPQVITALARQHDVCCKCTGLLYNVMSNCKHADEKEHSCGQGWARHPGRHQNQLWHIPQVTINIAF